jgi:hypothetical protein
VRKHKYDILNDAGLQLLFDGFSEVFFAGRIAPGVKVRFVASRFLKNKKQQSDARWVPCIREIHIDEMYARSEPMTAILLLHEMAHAALESTYVGQPTDDPGHGMIYQAELYRLFHAGAYDGLL